jgi:5,6-dimethylbenzimidazole synthase
MNVYEAIHSRRDVRRFRPDLVPDEVLLRILDAAHHAGSVGFMQPWNFLVIRSPEVRRKVFEVFDRTNARAAENYSGDRLSLYGSLKLQGILDAPLNLAVTCDRSRGGTHVLGRNTIIDTDVYSTCCAIQNLWLAARAEGIGVGWVSIFEPEAIKGILNIPDGVLLVGYLCVGFPVEFDDRPLLEKVGWAERLPLQELVFENSWGRKSETLFGIKAE